MKTKAKCRNCNKESKVLLRKSFSIKKWIKHKFTGKDVYIFKNVKAWSQYGAAITGVSCPKCKKHKLARI